MSFIFLIASVFLGTVIVFFTKPSTKVVQLLLSFSGAYLLSVTILHLIPEIYLPNQNTREIGVFILAGVLIQSVLESFSKGAEHGHIHWHGNAKSFPWLLFISLCLHAFSEGIPIHNHHSHSLLWAVVVHKVPIAIVLTTFLIHSKQPKKHVFLFITLFALMSPLGMLVADKIIFFTKYHTQITALIIGVFLHISTIILFESSENHSFNFQKFIATVLGILLTVFTI